MESSTTFYETELQNVQDQLAYYKKVASEMEEQNVILERQLDSQNAVCKHYTEKNVLLERELCEIKEEVSFFIFYQNLLICQSLIILFKYFF